MKTAQFGITSAAADPADSHEKNYKIIFENKYAL